MESSREPKGGGVTADPVVHEIKQPGTMTAIVQHEYGAPEYVFRLQEIDRPTVGEGSYAEYASVPAVQLALKPTNLTLEEAAAGPIAAFTALQACATRARCSRSRRS